MAAHVSITYVGYFAVGKSSLMNLPTESTPRAFKSVNGPLTKPIQRAFPDALLGKRIEVLFLKFGDGWLDSPLHCSC